MRAVAVALGVAAVLLALVFPAYVLHDARGRRADNELASYPWLYLRDGQPVVSGEQTAEVIAAGDVMLARGVAGERDPLAGVASWLRAADVAIANLECTVGPGGEPRPGPYRLQAPPSAARTLRRAGLDVLSLANNHALDYGEAGLAETAAALAADDLAAVGAGPDAASAQPVVRDVRGVRLAFFSFNAVPDPDSPAGAGGAGWAIAKWDETQAAAAVAAARAQADAVIVSVHWGYEYELQADPAQRHAAQALLDAGADLVIGSHPHVVQGTEVQDGRFIAYSLGNLVFDQQQGDTQQGLLLRAVFDRGGLRGIQALPVRAGPSPQPMGLAEAGPLLSRIQPAPQRLAYACERQPKFTCRTVEAPDDTLGTSVFRAGEIDLTGDGAAEQVQLVRGQVAVYDDGAETWHGLSEWRAVDVALGDPNDDGRGEMMLALWKNDDAGVPRSHPFIVGYREGAYRILWGGSAVAAPLLELELADVDGDGVQEMIGLEEESGDSSRVSIAVWRWHGWGFTLLWRSPPGRYQDLVIAPGQAGGAAIISVAVSH